MVSKSGAILLRRRVRFRVRARFAGKITFGVAK